MTRLKWKHISVLSKIVLILTQDRCMVCIERTMGLDISFGRPPCNSLVKWVMWNLTSFYLETVLVSVQDRFVVCTRRTIGSEIILDALDGTTS